ncbi:uncharacterized protein LOC132799216 isoform X1 [Ziziphus jujuba]|uniref:Uncharacterized protein LOC132799216 isoform X1 n=2 Tax=Ziziphus jujuba TaxID=326968 RepID=A0ABM4A332_ZIZJJ|nr:uncharacterized protein LOC132799216 isoform X1 [Ziziphus jujuba]
MYRDVSSCNSYNYGDALYWDARYIQEGGSFDWYQRYVALRPFVRKYISTNSRVLMVGCGNAALFGEKMNRAREERSKIGFFRYWVVIVMSEDMAKDGYEDIMNIDVSSVAIDLMKKKYDHVPQLKYMEMDVRDMSFFPDESFDGVIDKGTLDSLMCGTDAPISAAQMLGEVSRLLKPGGIYMLITYGDPSVRMPHLSRPAYSWKTVLYIIPRPGFEKPAGSSTKSNLEPIPTTDKGLLPPDYVLEDPDSHFIYVCKKTDDTELSNATVYPLKADVL